MTGLRILLVACEPAGAATYRYRNENLAEALNRAGHQAEVAYIGQSRIRVNHDIVVLHRICTVPEGIAFARAARKVGAALVYSTDDLVFDANAFPESGEPWTRIRAFAPLHAEMIKEADAALVSTEYLASEVRKFFGPAKPVFTIRNFLSESLLHRSEQAARFRIGKDTDAVTFGYLSGTATHDADMRMIAPPLLQLLSSRAKARLLIVGPLTLEGPMAALAQHERVFHQPFVPWTDLPAIIARTDINLAPLEIKHRFVRAKSEIKYLEAAAVGVPTIASPTEGFVEAVPADAIAFCSQNDNWRENIERLYDDADYRKELGERAYLHTLNHGTTEANAAHVAETFAQIADVPRLGRGDSTHSPRSILVNAPFAPPKYLVKALLRKLRI